MNVSVAGPTSIDLRRQRIEKTSSRVRSELDVPGYASMVHKFETNFDQFLEQFMKLLWSSSVTLEAHTHLSNLVTRLDYTGYFRNKFGDGASRNAPVSQ